MAMTSPMDGPLAGGALALVSAGLLSAALWRLWGPRGRADPARARRSPGDGPVILVQVMQADDTELVESACRFAEEQHGEIVLVYVIEVPWRLWPDAMPEQDAGGVLAAAREVAVRWDVPVRTVIWRDRVMLHGIAAAASRYHAHVVLSYAPSRGNRGHPEARGPAGS